MKAYGLAVYLLNANIYLQWAIRSGKNFGDYDFNATVQQIVPTVGSVLVQQGFKAGPLIIPAQYYTQAMVVINAFNTNATNSATPVAVYKLLNATTVPVLYNIVHKPLVAVLNSGNNYPIQTGYVNTNYGSDALPVI